MISDRRADRKSLEKAIDLHLRNAQKANKRGDSKLAAEELECSHRLRRMLRNL